MNNWSGVGNLVRDPESRVTQSGTDVCKFTIAINRIPSADGEKRADFIPVKAFKNLAARCQQYLRKGRKVAVVGELQSYDYTAQDGSKRFGMEIIAKEVDFLPSSDPNRTNLGDVHSDIHGPAHHDLGGGVGMGFTEVDDDELPF